MSELTETTEEGQDEEQCLGEGECDDPACEERKQYEIRVTREVVYTVSVHSEQEADTLGSELVWNTFSDVREESGEFIEDSSDDGGDYTVDSVEEIRRRDAEWRATIAAAMKEDEQ